MQLLLGQLSLIIKLVCRRVLYAGARRNLLQSKNEV